MVPTGDLATHQADLENAGFTILGTHNFNDIRGGDPQTLIVWGASASGDEFDGRHCFATESDNFYPTIWVSRTPHNKEVIKPCRNSGREGYSLL